MTIETPEQLDAVPRGSVLVDRYGYPWLAVTAVSAGHEAPGYTLAGSVNIYGAEIVLRWAPIEVIRESSAGRHTAVGPQPHRIIQGDALAERLGLTGEGQR